MLRELNSYYWKLTSVSLINFLEQVKLYYYMDLYKHLYPQGSQPTRYYVTSI